MKVVYSSTIKDSMPTRSIVVCFALSSALRVEEELGDASYIDPALPPGRIAIQLFPLFKISPGRKSQSHLSITLLF